METHCFTIGYQGRSLDDLCGTLFNMGVEVLVDIRERAWSQRPEFRKRALEKGLASSGIAYEHFKDAGNPFRPRKGEVLAFSDCAEQYRQYLKENPDIVEGAQQRIGERSVAFFCYEANTAECHRSVLLEELSELLPDLEVDHL